ncbi:potassium transporter [Planoprotostelium fungivorum]|uniref:Potassium transporter n=1 Tax=Planoprotostelium fungivorum TaxID=1890364 RepID=A0A2P6NWB7_9EUKA|nr:potassium transporter [Planoprotostelium fungivorum]
MVASPHTASFRQNLWLGIQALGVIFSEIGTAPVILKPFETSGQIYYNETISTDYSIEFEDVPTEQQILGTYSIILWTLILMASLKYVIVLLMANNHGEGGTFALCALLVEEERTKIPGWGKVLIRCVCVIGGSLIIGTGALNPAVKLSTAIYNLDRVITSYERHDTLFDSRSLTEAEFILVICVLVFIIFWINRLGPVALCWFLLLLGMGIYNVSRAPQILAALNPVQAVQHLVRTTRDFSYKESLKILGRTFVTITGCETIYADVGHFGITNVRVAWFVVVLPCLMISYLGNGAHILMSPQDAIDPFSQSWQDSISIVWLGFSFTIVMCAASSQTSGVFSTVSQAVGLGVFPPVTSIRKSKIKQGQVYIPSVNWILMLCTIALVVGFGRSGIKELYAVALAGLMLLTTCLFLCVLFYRRRWKWYFILPFSVFLIFDLFFLAGTCIEVEPGGWPAIIISLFFAFIMYSWYLGESRMKNIRFVEQKIWLRPTNSFVSIWSTSWKTSFDQLQRATPEAEKQPEITNMNEAFDTSDQIKWDKVLRTEGTGVFIDEEGDGDFQVPQVFENFVTRAHTAPSIILFLRVHTDVRPLVSDAERMTIIRHAPGLYTLNVKYGYYENRRQANSILRLARERGVPCGDTVTFFIHSETVYTSGYSWDTPLLNAYCAMKNNVKQTTVGFGHLLNLSVGVQRCFVSRPFPRFFHHPLLLRKPKGWSSREKDRAKRLDQR